MRVLLCMCAQLVRLGSGFDTTISSFRALIFTLCCGFTGCRFLCVSLRRLFYVVSSLVVCHR